MKSDGGKRKTLKKHDTSWTMQEVPRFASLAIYGHVHVPILQPIREMRGAGWSMPEEMGVAYQSRVGILVKASWESGMQGWLGSPG